MSRWPEVDDERQSAVLLRVDLEERRLRAAGESHLVVNLLLRVASAACLLNREKQAIELIERAVTRVGEWVAAPASPTRFGDLAATRGMLVLALGRPDQGVEAIAQGYLAQTAAAPPGLTQNARLAAALLLGDTEAANAALKGLDLSDAGLGGPWRAFAQAVLANDVSMAEKAASRWLLEKLEATHTNEWGGYNEVPIEVSAALALAARRGLHLRLDSNRVLTRFREAIGRGPGLA